MALEDGDPKCLVKLLVGYWLMMGARHKQMCRREICNYAADAFFAGKELRICCVPWHLFLRCQFAGHLWQLFLNIFGIKCVIPATMKQFLHSWMFFRGTKKLKHIPRTICFSFSTSSSERNLRCFEGKAISLSIYMVRVYKRTLIQNLDV